MCVVQNGYPIGPVWRRRISSGQVSTLPPDPGWVMQAIFNFDVVATELGPVAVVFKQDDISRLRPVALLIHGFLSDANDLLHWQDVLCADHEVVFVELPGHGRCPPQGDCSVAALTQRLRLVIRGLFPGRPIIAIGASLGGVIALALANGEVPEIVA